MTLHTASGRRLSPTAPSPADIAIEDIALALSRLCRWTGHLKAFYSVAQHSVLVSQVCPPAIAPWALLHDAAEAYLCDVPRPVKVLPALAGYRALEALWQRVIFQRFHLRGELPPGVADADDLVLAWEARDLVEGGVETPATDGLPVINPLRPTQAAALFLTRVREVLT